jgi:hypothetical protein
MMGTWSVKGAGPDVRLDADPGGDPLPLPEEQLDTAAAPWKAADDGKGDGFDPGVGVGVAAAAGPGTMVGASVAVGAPRGVGAPLAPQEATNAIAIRVPTTHRTLRSRRPSFTGANRRGLLGLLVRF